MAGAGQILGGTAKFHQNRDFVDQFARYGTDDMGPQHPVSAGIGKDFDKAIGGLIGLGPAIGEEKKFTCLVVNARGLELLFGLADGGNPGKV